MADRQLKIVVRTEIKKGFADLNKQMQQLSASMQKLGALSASIDRLANSFEDVAKGAKGAAKASNEMQKAQAAGLRIVQQYASAQEKLIQSVNKLRTSEKSRDVSKADSIKTQTRMLQEYIKKTNDLSILESKRDSKGRFGYSGFSSDAVKTVKTLLATEQKLNAELAKPITKKVKIVSQSDKSIMDIIKANTGQSNPTSARWEAQLASYAKRNEKATAASVAKTKSGGNVAGAFSPLSVTNLKNRAAGVNTGPLSLDLSLQEKAYDAAYNMATRENNRLIAEQKRANKALSSIMRSRSPIAGDFSPLNTTNLKNRAAGINTGALSLNQSIQDKEAARRLRAITGGGSGVGGGRGSGGGSGGIGRLPGPKDVDIAGKLLNNYNKLGHLLFQLQYSTLTILGATGLGFITKQIDAFISLKNEVARTSDNIGDLGDNMKTVFDISKKTFTDVGATGSLFSTINKYSGALGLDKKQVGNVTQNISAAFASSGGSKESRSAAQYQFLQGFQSGKFGGDELRSVLEAAPYVGDIMSRGLSKVRGGAPGSRLDLRAQQGNITPQEIAKIFNDPEFSKEIQTMLANRARTFGDVMSLAQTRLTEMAGKFEESTGLFGGIAKSIAAFLVDDKKFGDFTNALQAATVALIAYGATVGLSAGGKAIKGGIQQIGAVAGYGKAMGNFKGLLTPFGNHSAEVLAGGAAAERAAIGEVEVAMSRLSGPFAKIAKLMFGATEAATGLEIAFGVIGGVFSVATLAVVALAARFNYLLGQFGDGVTIFDIISGMWNKLGIAISEINLKLGPLGEFFSYIGQQIDKLLMRGVDAAKNDSEIQKAALSHQGATLIGGLTNKGQNATVEGFTADGKKIKGTIQKDHSNPGAGWQRDKDGRLLVYNNGKLTGAIDKDGGLPSGNKANFPPKTPTGTPKVDKWAEFMRDQYNQAADLAFNLQTLDQNFPANAADAFTSFATNVKKAADVAEINSKGMSIGDMLKAITGKKGHDFADTNLSQFKDKLTDLFRKQITDLTDALYDSMIDAAQNSDQTRPGLTGFQKARKTMFGGLVNKYRDTINPEKAMTALKDMLAVSGKDAGTVDGVVINGGSRRENIARITKQYGSEAASAYIRGGLSTEKGSDGLSPQELFDKEKDFRIQILNEDEASRTSWLEGMKSSMASYYDMITNASENWGNVVTTALQGLESTLVDFLTNPEFDSKSSFKALGLDITKAIATAFVRQNIMKPIMNKLHLGELGSIANPMYVKVVSGISSLFGGSGDAESRMLPMDSTGKLLEGFSNSAPNFKPDKKGGIFGNLLGGIKGFGGDIAGLFKGGLGNFGGNIASMFKGGGTGGWLSTAANFVASLFHEGGVVGTNSGMARAVSPAVFNNARKLHAGGSIGSPLAHNEVPAILKRGERVLTQGQQASMGGGNNVSFSPTISVHYTAGQGQQSSEGDAQAIGKMVEAQTKKQFNEFLLKARKDGGILSR